MLMWNMIQQAFDEYVFDHHSIIIAYIIFNTI